MSKIGKTSTLFSAPWFIPPPADPIADRVATSEVDDPTMLMGAGADRVASALAAWAIDGTRDQRRDVRLICMAILGFLGSGIRGGSLEKAIGLRRTDGKPQLAMIEKWARRDAQLAALAVLPKWSNRSSAETAAEIRIEYDRYVASAWTADQKRPGAPEMMPKSAYWRVAVLGLHYPWPNEQTMAARIQAAREAAGK